MSDTELTKLRTVAVHLLNEEVLHVILENELTLPDLKAALKAGTSTDVKYVLKYTGASPTHPTIKICTLNTRWVTRINY